MQCLVGFRFLGVRMKIFSMIVQSTLLVTTPALVAFPTEQIPVITVKHKKAHKKSIHIPDPRTLSYDEALKFLERIECDSFRENLSKEDLDRVHQFVSFLAMEGSTDGEKPAMATAIADLFMESDLEYASLLDIDFDAAATPAIFVNGTQDILLYKRNLLQSILNERPLYE
jgi:hypothetical protein